MNNLSKEEQKYILKSINHLIKEFKLYKVEQDFISKEIKSIFNVIKEKLKNIILSDDFYSKHPALQEKLLYELSRNPYELANSEYIKIKTGLSNLKINIQNNIITKETIFNKLCELEKTLIVYVNDEPDYFIQNLLINNSYNNKTPITHNLSNDVEKIADYRIEFKNINSKIHSEFGDTSSYVKNGSPRLIRVCYKKDEFVTIVYFGGDNKMDFNKEDYVDYADFSVDKDKHKYDFLEKLIIYRNEFVPYENLQTNSSYSAKIVKCQINFDSDNILEKYYENNSKLLSEKSKHILGPVDTN